MAVLSRSLLQSRLDIVANILELTMWSDPNDGLPLVPITYRHEGEGEGQFNGSVEVGGNCQLRNRSRAEVTEMRIVQELFLLLQEYRNFFVFSKTQLFLLLQDIQTWI